MTTRPPSCDWFWGSHGCDMPGGHDGTIHTCGTRVEEGPCSQYDTAAPPDARVRWCESDQPIEWGDWGPYGEGFGMGPKWGAPNITPPHTHTNPSDAVCHACTPPTPTDAGEPPTSDPGHANPTA